ncbi:MAG: type IV pilus biogenesis/stability protein PilW [Candidatus Accumulibacter sp.]|jgi:type IV pilus assembly protein PilF|nr:type IV pilus biogenesis/stability protein PilW [Accumulibacter sp.]
MMTMAIGNRFACFCAVTLLLGFAPPAGAQQSAPPDQANTLSSPMPKDPRTRAKAHTDLGALYFQDGNLIVALEELTLAAAIDPDYAPAFSTRGLVLYYVKELDSAEKDFQRALSLEERNPEINNNYGWFLCQTDRAKESIEYFERAYKSSMYQTPGNAYLNAGACHIKLNELDQADEALRKSLRLMPGNPRVLYYLADVYYRRGNFDAARKQLMDVVRVIEPGPEVLWLLLRVERRLGNPSDVQSLTTQLRRLFPDSAEYQELLKGNYE